MRAGFFSFKFVLILEKNTFFPLLLWQDRYNTNHRTPTTRTMATTKRVTRVQRKTRIDHDCSNKRAFISRDQDYRPVKILSSLANCHPVSIRWTASYAIIALHDWRALSKHLCLCTWTFSCGMRLVLSLYFWNACACDVYMLVVPLVLVWASP